MSITCHHTFTLKMRMMRRNEKKKNANFAYNRKEKIKIDFLRYFLIAKFHSQNKKPKPTTDVTFSLFSMRQNKTKKLSQKETIHFILL